MEAASPSSVNRAYAAKASAGVVRTAALGKETGPTVSLAGGGDMQPPQQQQQQRDGGDSSADAGEGEGSTTTGERDSGKNEDSGSGSRTEGDAMEQRGAAAERGRSGDLSKAKGAPLPIRILFLHSLDPAGDSVKVRLLQEAFGKDAVASPALGMRRTITAFSLAFAAVLLLMFAAVVLTFVKSNIAAGVFVSLSFVLVALLAFFLAGRGVTHLMLRQAVGRAEAAFKAARPNIIVAPAFGAVVALQMDCSKLPLVLLCPAQDQYYRYMHFHPLVSIADYPYTIIVHGSGDAHVPLDDSIRLVETCELGRCRLEVVDDDHSLRTLTKEDFRNWAEEVFEKGHEVVKAQVAKGAIKAFDLSLFEERPAPWGPARGLDGVPSHV